MNKEEYKRKVKTLLRDANFIEGIMAKKGIKQCVSHGVYAIFDQDVLIYIGSAYADTRTIEIRLKQYLGKSKTSELVSKGTVFGLPNFCF